MSTYYSYYIGYRCDGKIFSLGPYNAFGELRPALSRSRSFASDLYTQFRYLNDEEISDELYDVLTTDDYSPREDESFEIRCIDADLLPRGSIVTAGYFLISEVQDYEESGRCDPDVFSAPISSEVFAALVQHESRLANKAPSPRASDYMYYAYEDTTTQEYEASIIRCAIDSLERSDKLPNGAEIVVFEITE